MNPDIDRRRFLRGDFSQRGAVRRPPWSMTEALFVERCTRCDACLPECPEKILYRGDGGFPQVDFQKGGCSFCGACLAACETGALQAGAFPWCWTAVIGDRCLERRGVMCGVCGEQCETGAIGFVPGLGGTRRPQVSPDACTGCGACVAPCPVDALDFVPAVPALVPADGEVSCTSPA